MSSNSGVTYNKLYHNLLKDVNEYGIYMHNERTKNDIKVYPGGYSFTLDLSDNKLPIPSNRKYWPKSAAAETIWQLMGIQDLDFMEKHAPRLWEKFVDEKRASGKKLVYSAYGYRWRMHFGRDQIGKAIRELQHNPSSRQIYISAWDPAKDGLGSLNQPKNIPCPTNFALQCIDGKLYCSLFIRSSDIYVGLPYDIMNYSLLMSLIANETVLDLGKLHVTLAHAHYYMVHKKNIIEDLNHDSWTQFSSNIKIPHFNIKQVLNNKEKYMNKIVYNQLNDIDVYNNPWNPQPKIVE